MEVGYSLNPKDIQAFARYHRKLPSMQSEPSLRAAIGVLIIAIVMAGLGVLLPAFLFHGEGLIASWMGLLIAYLGAVFIVRWWQACMNLSIQKAQCEDPRSEWAVRDVRVGISPDQLRTVARGATCMYAWSRVWHIGVTDKHIFLCITRNTAIIIPRRAFRDATHLEEFLVLAQQYQQGRGGEMPKPTGIIAGLPPQSDAITRPSTP